MKRKSIFAAVFIMCFYIVNSQTKTAFNNLKSPIESITFPRLVNLSKITSLKMLGNIIFSETSDEDYSAKILPEKYNWSLDAFRSNSYKRMVLNFQKRDRYGRDLPRNINEDMVNQIYFRSQ